MYNKKMNLYDYEENEISLYFMAKCQDFLFSTCRFFYGIADFLWYMELEFYLPLLISHPRSAPADARVELMLRTPHQVDITS